MGVTEAMVGAYGDTVFDLSHNIQVRVGDPVRMLDWDQIEQQRPGTGMSDGQIAEKIGLTRDQVTHIRLLLEHRRFQRDHYHRLYKLGGGKRFRAERYEGTEARRSLSDAAMALREAFDFDPRDAGRYIRTGLWGSATPAGRLRALAKSAGDRPALITAAETMDYAELLERAERAAGRLAENGVGAGDVVAIEPGSMADLMLAYCAVSLMGAVLCPLPAEFDQSARRVCLTKVSAIGLFGDLSGDASNDAARPSTDEAPVAGDPLAILFADPDGGLAAIHNAHTLLAGLDEIATRFGLSSDDRLSVAGTPDGPIGLVAINLAIAAGAAIDDAGTGATVVFCRDTAAISAAAALRLVIATGGDMAALEARLGSTPVCRALISGEAQFMLAGTPGDDTAARHGADGLPNPAMSVRAVSADDGEIVEPGKEGMLEIHGANLMASYLGDEKANRTAFTGDRWLRTGARCVILPGGAVEILGR